jgi:hypothetical protein
VKLLHSPRQHTITHADINRCHPKKTAIYQQQHSCETLICQRHQTILRLLSSAATASTRWRVRELYCPTTYFIRHKLENRCLLFFTLLKLPAQKQGWRVCEIFQSEKSFIDNKRMQNTGIHKMDHRVIMNWEWYNLKLPGLVQQTIPLTLCRL